ncbi:hypothetical protein AGMMS50229_09960 [Campylobacterota bacterium]|nr:hypothetical protein AGMMS50229_09960 [Campylobacterota bacterium]
MWEIEYYEKSNGDCPVSEFLDALPPKLMAKALRSIDLLAENGITLTEPYVKAIDGAIWELRVKFASDITRIFYFVASKKHLCCCMVLSKRRRKRRDRRLKSPNPTTMITTGETNETQRI